METRKHNCPICNQELNFNARYPNRICSTCADKATDMQGKKLAFGNVSRSGGFEASYADTGETYNSHICYVNGIECYADEARFGGIIIEKIITPLQMNALAIKKIQKEDILQLQEISRQTFIETFADQNKPEDMQLYLENNLCIATLQYEMNEPNSSFYFALHDQKVIGYLKMNFGKAQTETLDDNSVEIERIYVLKAFYGKKVGQALYDKALMLAHEAKANYVWLGVWEKNHRAIQFYKKNGFVVFDQHVFKLGNDEQTDLMMRLNLD